MPRTKSLPSKIMTQPGAIDPFSSIGGKAGKARRHDGGWHGGMGGMGMGAWVAWDRPAA